MRSLAPATRMAQRQLLERAVELLQRRRTREAQAVLQAVLERWPEQPDALNFLGVLKHQQGDSEAAVTLLRRATRGEADSPGAWNNLGNVLAALQRHGEAEQAYRECLTRQPDFSDAIGNLAAMCSKQGRLAEAAGLYRQALRLEPDNMVLRHHLAACIDEAPPARASDGYLQEVFDRDASQFEARLGSLHYQAPQRLAELLERQLPPPTAQYDIADLGCGTGLCAPLVQPWARSLVGCDLSAGMLDLARMRGQYTSLFQEELESFLQARPGAFDGLVCTDTLIYVGDLHAAMAAAAGSLRPGGWFGFSVEALSDDDTKPFRLLPHGRYAHRRDHVLDALKAARMRLAELESFTVRNELGVGAPGWLVLARTTADA
jgi:predicted TPR repeat methyltransferase